MAVRRRGLAGGLLVALLAWIPLAPANAGNAKPDWILTKATASRVTRISSEFAVSGHSTGTGPLVIGLGFSVQGGPHPFSWVSVGTASAGAPGVGVSAGPVNQYLAIEELADGRKSFRYSPLGINDKARTVSVLFFAVNGVIDDVTWVPYGSSARVTSTVRSGVGSRALFIGENSVGAAASAGGLGAGFVSFSRQVGTGIAGAIDWSCRVCAGTWTPPNGPVHRWALETNEAGIACWCSLSFGMDTQFAGPAGRWAWEWAGSTAYPVGVLEGAQGPLRRPALAAYAPIGRDWSLFKDCRYSNGCVLCPERLGFCY